MKVLSCQTGYLFEQIFAHLPSPTVLMDREFRILQANAAFLDAFDLSFKDIRNHDFLKLVRPGEVEEQHIRELLQSELNENHDIQFEAFVPTGPESGIWAIIDSRVFTYQDQTFYLSVLNDVTARKKEKESLKSDDAKMRQFFDDANDLIQSVSADGALLYTNKKWQETLGYSAAEISQLNITDIVSEDEIPHCFKILNKTKNGEKCELIETVFKTKDGRDIFVEGNVDGCFEYGKFISTRGIFRDISARKTLQETYSSLVHNFPSSIYIIQKGQFLFVNPSFQTLTGYSDKELEGKDALFLVHPEDAPFVQKTIVRLLKSNKSASYEFRLIRKSGEVRWVMETVISIPYEGKTALLGTMVDLTERKMVEGALEESKDRYQTLFNSASDAFIIHDLDGRLLEVNDAACNLLKYNRQDLLKLSLSDIRAPEGRALIADHMRLLQETGYIKIESENYTRDGRVVPVEIHGIIIDYDRKKAVLNVVRDISERKQTEAMRKRYQARLESQLKISEFKGGNSQDLLYFALDEIIKLTGSKLGFIYYYDRQQRAFSLDSWSRGVLKAVKTKLKLSTFGLDKTGILGDAVRLQKAVILNSPQIPGLFQNGFPEGPYQLDNYMAVPILISKQTVAVVGVAGKVRNYEPTDNHQVDIFMTSIWNTLERWKAEEALRDSEQRFRQLIECSQDGILGIDEDGIVLMANPTACKMMGYTEEELKGADFSMTCLPEERHFAYQRLSKLKSTDVLRFERQALRKDGSQFPIDIAISPLSQGHFQEVIRDITARKKMEHELQESEQKFRLLVENQADLVVELNPAGEFLFVNPSYCKLIGKTKEELVRTQSYDLIHPDDKACVKTVNETMFNPPYTCYSEHRVETSRGWRWLAWTSNAVLDADNNITAFTCMGRDITESKQAKEDLEKANQQLRELDKLKDNFLSTVSHELRTPLTSIKSFVEILLSYDEDKATQKEFLGIINEESDRLTRLINDFLDLSKIQAGRIQWKFEEVNVPDVVNSAMYTAKALMDKNKLSFKTDIQPDLPKVLCDKDRLLQVYTNLLGNASKFTPEGGQVIFRVWHDQTATPDFVTASITDSGIGIAPENHARIFENFGQVGDVLKDRPKGTGLGLPITKKIIENYGGKIWLESTQSKGTTFLFTLPIVKPK